MTFHGDHGLLLGCLFLNLLFRAFLLRIQSILLSLGSRVLLCGLSLLFLRCRLRGFLLLRDGILGGKLLLILLLTC